MGNPTSLKVIRKQAEQLRNSPVSDLGVIAKELKQQIRCTSNPERFIASCFGLLDTAIWRVKGFSAYNVQLKAARELTGRRIVEMATGEGKTLTALFPLFYFALQGKGVLLATANDYLADRDASLAEHVFAPLGLTVGSIVDGMADAERKVAYAKDITYGTAAQFGFDFLRDRSKQRFNRLNPDLPAANKVQRDGLFSVIVDEVDSLLIDEAATPLIISSAPPPVGQDRIKAIQLASKLAPSAKEGHHYDYRKIEKKAELTNLGRLWATKNVELICSNNLSLVDWYETLETAIAVHRDFATDRNYLVDENSDIQLIDQETGRVAKGRQWSEGVHQAIQAKERLEITAPNGFLAKVTLQSFFLSFEHLSGMTGTASDSKSEFKKIYKLGITPIPTHRKNLRRKYKSRAFTGTKSWLDAILHECHQMIESGRSVLVGARNLRLSEAISKRLNENGLPNRLLNARHDSEESSIVALAGQPNSITVATNMAGRGTDIELHRDVKNAGGLHVILGGMHESKRIDRQLIGRAARQGDPGSYRIMICMEDDLLDEAFTTAQAIAIRQSLASSFSEKACLRWFRKAQGIISSRRRVSRSALFHNEKKNLKHLARAGIDPLLDLPQ